MSAFGPDTLPLGVFRLGDEAPRVGAAYEDHVIDLTRLDDTFAAPSLNRFLALGPGRWRETREWLLELAQDPPHLIPLADVRMQMPFEVGDYVDFYASEHHASNLGRLFRPDAESPLLPNWKHLPVGYHGRAGTVVVSGTPVQRPSGQRKAPADTAPTFGPSQRLDIEVELGYVVGRASSLGTPVPVDAFAEHVYGAVLLNDWSARDIQAWEYQPLGPFLGKSFATSISPWVVSLDALADTAVPLGPQQPAVLPHLSGDNLVNYNITFEVRWNGQVVSNPPYASMYWSPAQMLAHLTSNGASVRTGDLFASGTVSGPEANQRGSFLELSWGGREPITVNGSRRTFLQDGDEVLISGWATRRNGGRVPLGEVGGRIVPAVTTG